MKRKFSVLLLLLSMLMSLAACSGEVQQELPSGTGADTAAQADKPAFAFVRNGHTLAVHMDMADVLTAIGEANSYFEAESCAFNGLDKTYTYSGFTITTRPEGETDFVQSILLTDDSVTTAEGIYIGSNKEDVTAAYGAAAEETETLLAYEKAGYALQFILAEDKVISIEYIPAD